MPAIETAIAQLDALLASLKTRAAGDNASPVADGSSSKPVSHARARIDCGRTRPLLHTLVCQRIVHVVAALR